MARRMATDNVKLSKSNSRKDSVRSRIFSAIILFIPLFLLVATHIQYSHITEAQADTITAHYSGYDIRGDRSPFLYMFFSDHDSLIVRWYAGVADELEKTAQGEELTLQLHPRGDYIMGIYSRDRTILDFAYAQKKADTERRAFVIICCVMYASLLFLYLICADWQKRISAISKKLRRKRAK